MILPNALCVRYAMEYPSNVVEIQLKKEQTNTRATGVFVLIIAMCYSEIHIIYTYPLRTLSSAT